MQAVVGDEAQGKNEVTPRNQETENADGNEAGERHGQDDHEKRSQLARPVHQSGLDQFVRQILHICGQHYQGEWNRKSHVGQNQPIQRIHEVDLGEHNE